MRAAKPDDLSSIPRNHFVEGKNRLHSCLWPPLMWMCSHTYTQTHTHIHQIKITNKSDGTFAFTQEDYFRGTVWTGSWGIDTYANGKGGSNQNGFRIRVEKKIELMKSEWQQMVHVVESECAWSGIVREIHHTRRLHWDHIIWAFTPYTKDSDLSNRE